MDELRVLITTDNHLGFLERDHIRGEDSFRAFEEVFEHALRLNVDAVLMAGDLFHDVNPSKYTMYRTVEILRKYCLGDRPIHIECRDNGNFTNLSKEARPVNYYNANLNISMPVFSIHGNHDEPSGHRGVASLNILAEAGLVNYFGCIDSMANTIEVRPILLKKGQIALNLYGIGGLRDERMVKLLAEERISFEKPEGGTSLLVLHQTRCCRGANVYLPDHLLSRDMDLVVWGHMHDSYPVPEKNHQMGFHSVQPGSTVQTSLCQAESRDKHCVLLKVTPSGWATDSIPMQSTRQLIFKHIAAAGLDLVTTIQSEMKEILAGYNGAHRPLVRLRVDVSDKSQKTIIQRRVLEEFKDKVANPKDVLRLIYRRQKHEKAKDTQENKRESKTQFTLSVDETRILSPDTFISGILECIDKQDKTAVSKRYNEIISGVVSVLKSHRWTDIEAEITPAVQEIDRRIMGAEDSTNRPKMPRMSTEIRSIPVDPQSDDTYDFANLLENQPTSVNTTTTTTIHTNPTNTNTNTNTATTNTTTNNTDSNKSPENDFNLGSLWD
ncbi:double-strand break repair protein MRE11 [Nematocida homosporus]|uniref:double-strand break repair protein MRE11 n=1 Tax=Nematocida homosporus TaxID=1912981 RepID=UPI00221F3C07|nr:double-strand break repair protein MRE11 [Nematocida homosporus]KAI5184815.1 double-strand break repair protein MRE11 [Nematocida homosporus]